MTFKDEIKAADAKAAESKGETATDGATASDNDDIARLLRALNEDLKADPRAVPTDDPDDEDDADAGDGGGRGFPLGKIVLALLAAGGVGIGVVMFDGSSPSDAPQTAAVAPVASGGTSPAAPPPLTLNPKPAGNGAPESLIARAPTPGPTPAPAPAAAPAATVPAPVPPIPAPPGRVEPAPVPPPVLPAAPSGTQTVVKPIEPPAIPKLDPPKPAEAKAPAPKAAEPKPAEPKPVEAKAPEILKAPEPKAPEIKAAEPAPPPAEAKAPEAGTADLQAMLSPPKPAQPAAKAGKAKPAPAATPAAPAAPSAPRTATSATGRWMVQAGSFSVVENAEAVVRKLAAKGYSAQVIDWTDASQRTWKVVRVGGYDNPADAKRVAGELKAAFGLSPMVVSAR